MLEEVEHLLSLEILEPPYAINFVLHTPTQGGDARDAAQPARRAASACATSPSTRTTCA